MKLILIGSLSLSFIACVEPEATVDPTARTGPVASEPEVDVTAGATAEHAPQCGDGDVTFWDWVCRNDGLGWRLEVVGFQTWNCDQAPGHPYIEPLIGRSTTCKSSDRSECSTNLPSATCTFAPTGSHCGLPKPTSWCFQLPPLPPIVPPGGGVNG